ncbi:SCO2521 family protein [Streptomyces sp. V4-01]|uniref:SCO2521 family protein n=1 Tax=Actinacidiphila polyblastidii TaxID=3110430 RepID=A0ABU7PB54_9ACTN|nr:SCO2521 family protein [Streptomyces sp. V4-01]
MAVVQDTGEVTEQSDEPVLLIGEVRTCLLPHSQAMTTRGAADLLRLRAGEQVRRSERPNSYVRSPPLLTGVDCHLPTASGGKVRAVGTVTAHATLTEGRLLQSGAYCAVTAHGPRSRRRWGHYLARPGVVEPFGTLSERDVADGSLGEDRRPGELALGAIVDRTLSRVLRDRALDQRPPFTSQATALRWVGLRAPDGEGASLTSFTLAGDGCRTAELRLPAGTAAEAAAGLCHDLSLHDWLLTSLVRVVELSRLGSTDGRDSLAALRPAVDHLIHLWLPGSRVASALLPLWEALERHPGFTRQWSILVQRIRDQLALQTAVHLLP